MNDAVDIKTETGFRIYARFDCDYGYNDKDLFINLEAEGDDVLIGFWVYLRRCRPMISGI